ncbi:MAG: CRISPR-associated helicase Cas3' [Bacteroidetes bacterium]|nr:CRISPR-associated helicase Cas3' [Bacteroidota bacterium]
MRSIREITANTNFSVPGFIREHEKYIAHLSKDGNERETLHEHTSLVIHYFVKLVEANGLDRVIDDLVFNFLEKNGSEGIQETAELIKEAFAGVVLFHDFGKINPGFQYEKMKNPGFRKQDTLLGSHHSEAGAYFFTAHFMKLALERGILKLEGMPPKGFPVFYMIIALSYPLRMHHGQLYEAFCSESSPFNPEVLEELKALSEVFIPDISSVHEILTKIFDSNSWKNIVLMEEFLKLGNTAAYSLIKMSFSLLTAADYYATNQFMSGMDWNDFGIFSDRLKEKFCRNLYSIEYNKRLKDEEREKLKLDPATLSEMSNENLNRLRSSLASEVLGNIAENKDKRLFYLEAPTGSGKTNLSFLAASELIQNDDRINKIFYVFPFTTLITQTHKTLTEAIGLTNEEVAELHSKSGSTLKHNPEDEIKDGQYGSEKQNYLTEYFYNYPVILTSHVRFFSLMLSHRKDRIYGFHRLANSIVIIDEIQSYNPEIWDKLIFAINEYADLLNIRFFIMSATLPKISKLLNMVNDPFVSLVKNRDAYFTNPNFMHRVEYDFSLLKDGEFDLDEFASKVSGIVQPLLSQKKNLKVLIEFVTKKNAGEFYSKILNREDYSSIRNKFLLSGNILEPRRKDLIQRLKGEITGPVIVVATQVVEAGVDIDMDIGFKDRAIPDAEEQFAGRVNRNAGKKDCRVFIFNSGKANDVYRGDKRLEIVKKELSGEDYADILKEKRFEEFYDRVLSKIDARNRLNFAGGFEEFKKLFKRLEFQSIDREFRLIEDDSVRVFVPLSIELELLGEREKETARHFDLVDSNDCVSGKELFAIWNGVLAGKDDDFVRKSAKIKNIAALMSNFSFSVSRYGKEFKAVEKYGEFVGDLFYLREYSNVYTFENGIESDVIDGTDDINFI